MYFVYATNSVEQLSFVGFVSGDRSSIVTNWLRADNSGPDHLEINDIPTVYFRTHSLRPNSIARWTYCKVILNISRQPSHQQYGMVNMDNQNRIANRTITMIVPETPLYQLVTILTNGTPVLMPNNDSTVQPLRPDSTMLHSLVARFIRLQADQPPAPSTTTAAIFDANQPAPTPPSKRKRKE